MNSNKESLTILESVIVTFLNVKSLSPDYIQSILLKHDEESIK